MEKKTKTARSNFVCGQSRKKPHRFQIQIHNVLRQYDLYAYPDTNNETGVNSRPGLLPRTSSIFSMKERLEKYDIIEYTVMMHYVVINGFIGLIFL